MTSQGYLQMLRPSLCSTFCLVAFTLASIIFLWKKWKWIQTKQMKLRGSLYSRTSNSKDFIICFLYFSLPWSCCHLTGCSILEDHSSMEGLLLKVWNTSVLNPGPLVLCCVALGKSFDFTVSLSSSIIWDYESQSLGMTNVKQYLLDRAASLNSWAYRWCKLPV